MIDIFARYIDNKIVFEPRKRRGMTKGEYLRAVSACQRLNADGIPHSSSVVAFLPPDIIPDQAPLLQLHLFGETNILEPEPIAIVSHPADDRQPKRQDLSCKLEK